MAEPPEHNETFLREVDENLRRDRVHDFWKKYGLWVGVAVGAFLIASGGFIWWQNHKLQQSEAQVEQFAEVLKNVGQGSRGTSVKQLDDLSENGSKAVRATALFTRAAMAIEDNDLKLAAAKYGEIAGDSSLPKPFRDAALIRQTALQFDQLQPSQVIDRLAPLAKPGAPWFGTAGEMSGLALIKQGHKDQAAKLFSTIAKDNSVPPEIRSRSVQLAGSLGVDASSFLAGPRQ